MSHNKRSRAAYEADLHDWAATYVTFGTPLSPLEPDARDDGSYVPLHKQEVRDDRGRRRFHGAFTGGWSAGYFNTVGTKEGWLPSTFVSSRVRRRKDDPKAASQRPEDYMDDEDLADTAAAQEIRINASFSALGASEAEQPHGGGLAGLVRIQGDTMGLKLLRKMGWKNGQGIGPKIRRKARLGTSVGPQSTEEASHLFAPEDVELIAFPRKSDRQGLGYEGERRLSGASDFKSRGSSFANFGDRDYGSKTGDNDEEGNEDSSTGRNPSLGSSITKKNHQGQRGGFGVGILNDTGSDVDDPYEMGPRISYNRVLGGGKAKRKKKLASAKVSANPTLRAKPIFVSRPALAAKGPDKESCLDGRPPLHGFILGRAPCSRLAEEAFGTHSLPVVSAGWVSNRKAPSMSAVTKYISTADAAKAAQLDPKTRATILGEASLPGKSVFDFMSSAARDRLARASGRSSLPPAKGEIPADYARTGEQRLQDRLKDLPTLSKETAIAAMSRGAGAGGPYSNDDAKRGRYRLYLQSAAGFGSSPVKPRNLPDDDFLKELEEFHNCAQLFKPMTGFMATRFTTASTGSKSSAGIESEAKSFTEAGQPTTTNKPLDAAEEAARLGMYGRMTRLTEGFCPTRLLCKRFNVRPPSHVQPDQEPSGTAMPTAAPMMRSPISSLSATADTMTGVRRGQASVGAPGDAGYAAKSALGLASEATRPGEEVFKAIFGDSSDEDE